MRCGYDRVEGSIGRSYDEIRGVSSVISQDNCLHGYTPIQLFAWLHAKAIACMVTRQDNCLHGYTPRQLFAWLQANTIVGIVIRLDNYLLGFTPRQLFAWQLAKTIVCVATCQDNYCFYKVTRMLVFVVSFLCSKFNNGGFPFPMRKVTNPNGEFANG